MCAQSIIKSITPVEQETEVILNPFHLWLGLRLGLRFEGDFPPVPSLSGWSHRLQRGQPLSRGNKTLRQAPASLPPLTAARTCARAGFKTNTSASCDFKFFRAL